MPGKESLDDPQGFQPIFKEEIIKLFTLAVHSE